MTPHIPFLARSLAVLLFLGLAGGPRSAQGETTSCTAITTVPFTIPASGIYCLTGDLTTNLATGVAITIAANNVVLDLNGHKLGNLAAGPGTTAIGIVAKDRKDLTIKNGTVQGFIIAISVVDTSNTFTTSQGHVIEDLRVDRNTSFGIEVEGRGNLIRNNHVVATGGSTIVGASGIVVLGPENQVLNNDVIHTFVTAIGSSRGIEFQEATDSLAVNNRITQGQFGIFFSGGTGKFLDNLT